MYFHLHIAENAVLKAVSSDKTSKSKYFFCGLAVAAFVSGTALAGAALTGAALTGAGLATLGNF